VAEFIGKLEALHQSATKLHIARLVAMVFQPFGQTLHRLGERGQV
jgi:hypothetical protein